MRSVWKIIWVVFLLGAVGISAFGCASKPDSALTSESQMAEVRRGNLVIDITAVGNLALSRTEDLAFEIAGTVAEVLVEEGDSVEEEQVLANLDTSEWDKQLKTLEKALVTAQRSLTTKERALTSAEDTVIDKERALTAAERQVATKELAVRQAELDVRTAENSLKQITDVKKAQDAVDRAQNALDFAKNVLSGDFGGGLQLIDYGYWAQAKANAEEQLSDAEQDLQDILDGTSVTVSSDVALQVATSQLQIERKQMALEDAEIAVDDANQAVKDAQLAIENAKQDVQDALLDRADAEQNVIDAQSALDEARSKSPVITAPFAGFIARVNVEGGDEVLKGTVAVQLADPNKFEADILVSEMDIMQVKLEGVARVSVDAAQGISLTARVTHISPTATISQGVVNYKVKVELQSPGAITQQRQAQQQGMPSANMTQGELPEQLKQAIEAGRITREQAEAFMQQRGQGLQEGSGMQRQITTAVPENFQLREGLTVTVSITVDERNDVLLVPNSAITTQGGQTFVRVVTADGTLEQRAIQTGISDYQFTEVTDGLSEGEKVAIPQGTTATSPASSQGQRQQGGTFFAPGMGGPPR